MHQTPDRETSRVARGPSRKIAFVALGAVAGLLGGVFVIESGAVFGETRKQPALTSCRPTRTSTATSSSI